MKSLWLQAPCIEIDTTFMEQAATQSLFRYSVYMEWLCELINLDEDEKPIWRKKAMGDMKVLATALNKPYSVVWAELREKIQPQLQDKAAVQDVIDRYEKVWCRQ